MRPAIGSVALTNGCAMYRSSLAEWELHVVRHSSLKGEATLKRLLWPLICLLAKLGLIEAWEVLLPKLRLLRTLEVLLLAKLRLMIAWMRHWGANEGLLTQHGLLGSSLEKLPSIWSIVHPVSSLLLLQSRKCLGSSRARMVMGAFCLLVLIQVEACVEIRLELLPLHHVMLIWAGWVATVVQVSSGFVTDVH